MNQISQKSIFNDVDKWIFVGYKNKLGEHKDEENTDDTHFEIKNEFENAELCKENFKAPRYFPYKNS